MPSRYVIFKKEYWNNSAYSTLLAVFLKQTWVGVELERNFAS